MTPHYWTARPAPGVILRSSRRVAAAGPAVGAGGYQEMVFAIAGTAPGLVFDLAVSGQPPVMSRRLQFA